VLSTSAPVRVVDGDTTIGVVTRDDILHLIDTSGKRITELSSTGEDAA
jgi:predicted transcriptional regulator